jgi:hypothetical protein
MITLCVQSQSKPNDNLGAKYRVLKSKAGVLHSNHSASNCVDIEPNNR